MNSKFTKRRILKELASLKLAVIIILSLATVVGWGTIVEAQYDANIANKIVYSSIWMYLVMGALCVNLTAVMVDRWPWKMHHTGFVCAHIGIMILLLGALVTKKLGVDGSMSLSLGQRSNRVVTGEQDLQLWSTTDGNQYTRLYDYKTQKNKELDFYLNPPTKEEYKISLPEADIEVIDFLPFAIRQEKIVESKASDDGAAVRLQISNANMNMTEWFLQSGAKQDAQREMGPAQFILTQNPLSNYEAQLKGKNAFVMRMLKTKDPQIEYAVYSRKENKKIKTGFLKAGEKVMTGWMDMQIGVLKLIPQAKEEVSFTALEKPTPLTVQAIKVRYQARKSSENSNENMESWVQLNSSVKFFKDNIAYVLLFQNRRLNLDFNLQLSKFNIGRYQGTMRASSYESQVVLFEKGAAMPNAEHPISDSGPQIKPDIKISMNEPLKYGGYTFYQSSFQEDETGKPFISILSVNRDPGRWLKYLGSLIMVFGIGHLFWLKTRAKRKE